MTRAICCLPVGVFTLLAAAVMARSDVPADAAGKYTLRYQFPPGETFRWEVVHMSRTRTSVSGTTKTAETTSRSVKAWRVRDVQPDGTATFEHQVENVDMEHRLTGHARVRYNSQTDDKPPAGFEHVAQSVGVPLSVVTMNARGMILDRQRKQVKAAAKSEGQMTIPLPEEAVPVGHTWSFPYTIDVPLGSGAIQRVKTLQAYELVSVKTGVATIRVATRILTPIDDPALQSQVIQHASTGTVRFDVDAGRILSQQMDVDKHVVGFRGPASSIHYLTRFTEKLLPEAAETASRTDGTRR